MSPCVFVDRDGVLIKTQVHNSKPYSIRSMNDFELLEGVLEGVSALAMAGFKIIGITNQPDVGNGLVDQSVVEGINNRLIKELELDGFYTCFHSQQAGCDCRKPKPGLILQAASDFDIDLSRSYMIGDRFSDIQAGSAAGCRTIFIDCGYLESVDVKSDFVVHDFLQATTCIL